MNATSAVALFTCCATLLIAGVLILVLLFMHRPPRTNLKQDTATASSRDAPKSIRVLSSSEQLPHTRVPAAKRLGESSDRQATETLIVALKDHDRWRRKRAVEALGKLGDGRATGPLIATLKDPSEAVRKAAANALGRLGEVNSLVSCLGDSDAYVRSAAVEALSKRKDPRTIAALTAALKGDNHTLQLRGGAVAFLDKLGWQPGQDAAGIFYWTTKGDWQRCAEIGLPAAETLMLMLDDDEPIIRAKSVRALVRISAGLRDKHQRNRILKSVLIHPRCARSLPLDKMDPDADIFHAYLNDEPEAIEPLIATFRSGGAGDRENATEALLLIVKNLDNQALRAELAVAMMGILNDDSFASRWAAAIRVLSPTCCQLQDPVLRNRAVRSIIAGLRDSDSAVQYVALEAFSEIRALVKHP